MNRIGIAISGGPNPAEIVDLVVLAESLGYESAWVAEGHGGDQFAVLAACAGQRPSASSKAALARSPAANRRSTSTSSATSCLVAESGVRRVGGAVSIASSIISSERSSSTISERLL